MKTFILPILAALLLQMTSCVELPDLNPATNENVIVTELQQSFTFDQQSTFFRHIDINGNGTTDFYFYGLTYAHPEMGTVDAVMLDGNYEYNTVIKRPDLQMPACGTTVEFSPARELDANFNVGWGAQWGPGAAMYMRATPTDGCSVYRNFLDRRNQHYFGLKFTDEGNTYYGWILIKAGNVEGTQIPGCASDWTIVRCAFNQVPETSVRIPA